MLRCLGSGSLILSLCFVWGCQPVRIDRPLGTPVAASDVRLEGVWRAVGEPIVLHVKDLGGGKLKVAATTFDAEKQQFRVQQHDYFLTRLNTKMYLSWRDQPDNEKSFQFFRLESKGRVVKLRSVMTNEFAKAVQDGTLDGEVAPDDAYVLLRNTPRTAASMESLNDATLFSYEPLLLERIVDEIK